MGTFYQSGIQTKSLILDESKKLFYSKGYCKTTYSDISAAAKMNRALIPYHFKSKHSLGSAVCMDIINQTNQTVKEMLDTDALSDDLSGALEIVSFYHLLNNSQFVNLLFEVVNDNCNSFFEIEDEKRINKMLGTNIKKIDDSNSELLAHVSAALKKEAIIYYSESNMTCDTNKFAQLHIQTLMNYAGYSKKTITELIDPAIQLSDLLNYEISKDFSINISYK